jgi:hypothetical protein
MLLAVFSYPKNYHITQLTIRHAIRHIPNIKQVAVIWDDTHDIQPSAQLSQVIDNCTIYNWSGLSNTIKFQGNNWLEQQLVKLHLDLMLNKEEFIMMDGDLIVNQNIDPVNILYSNSLPRVHGKYDHLRELLGLGVYDFSTNPFMYYKARWLKNIRELCETNSHAKIDKKLFDTFEIANQTNALLEWNIMARYLLDVLKLPKKVEYFHRHSVKGPVFANVYNDEENFVCDGPDNIGLKFYESKGIHIDYDLMSKLGY